MLLKVISIHGRYLCNFVIRKEFFRKRRAADVATNTKLGKSEYHLSPTPSQPIGSPQMCRGCSWKGGMMMIFSCTKRSFWAASTRLSAKRRVPGPVPRDEWTRQEKEVGRGSPERTRPSIIHSRTNTDERGYSSMPSRERSSLQQCIERNLVCYRHKLTADPISTLSRTRLVAVPLLVKSIEKSLRRPESKPNLFPYKRGVARRPETSEA